MKIFITGVCGLLGSAARSVLEDAGVDVCGCDLRSDIAAEKFDFRDIEKTRAALKGCDGVLHLAAVSRVVWGETHPELCRAVNVRGAKLFMREVTQTVPGAWFVFASSREIYGAPPKLPCTADTPPSPENLYARTKLAGEKMVRKLRDSGMRTAVLRFSNVFGSVDDHADRVVPAFAAAAAQNRTLTVYGGDSLLDFTPLADAADAILRAVNVMNNSNGSLPPIDVVTGRATSLLNMAKMAVQFGNGVITCEPPRAFYPARFQGDPLPAKDMLGWEPRVNLESAVRDLVEQYKLSKQNARS